ncbi:MAG: hypothetical protein OEZ19_00380 [Paracoccaceae bacterium]|nr:hypothetical protein [Paracoccaceae bacterium]
MRSRLAVIMVADVVGYSRMMADDEQASIVAVRDLNETYMRPQSESHGGEILKRMGDGWIIAFGSVQSGIACALEILQALSGNEKIKIRIGAHIGEITEDDEDFYGAGVNLASRLEGQAPPGGMMVSQDLFRQLTGELAGQFEDAGSFELKNIPYPVQGYQWRPRTKASVKASKGEVPTLLVEKFEYAPAGEEAQSHAEELREQILMNLSRRAGIRTLESTDGGEKKTVYRIRGRLRLSGSRARMTVSMVLCETGETLFSKNYDGDVSDIFEFADRITGRVNADLRIQINAYDANRLAELSDDELSISELRSRAANCFYKATYESWDRGLSLMERAVELTPDDPMSVGMRAIADLALHSARMEPMNPDRALELEDGLNTAIAAAPKIDFLYTVRSQFNSMIRKDADSAIRDAEFALKLNPTYHVGFGALAYGHMLQGNFSKAISVVEHSLSLETEDPLEFQRLFPLAICYCLTDQTEKAKDILESMAQRARDSKLLQKTLAMVLRRLGDDAGAAKRDAIADGLTAKPSITVTFPPLPEEYADTLKELVSAVRG